MQPITHLSYLFSHPTLPLPISGGEVDRLLPQSGGGWVGVSSYHLSPKNSPLRRTLFFVLLVLLIAACGGNPAPTPTAETASQPGVAETPAATDTPVAAPAVAVPIQPAGSRAAAQLEPQARNGMYTAPPEMSIDLSKVYYATLKTEKGDIRVQLFADRVPVTVNNFVFLAREGFYDNTTFHRVLDNFMAQAGDPTGTGSGGPGYQFQDEFVPGLGFDRPNLLAMANSGPRTNGSQFFITFAPTDWLNNLHTIFGEVISGQEVLDQITRRDPGQNPTEPGDALLTIEIEEGDSSVLPTPMPPPPTPTPFAPSSIAPSDLTAGDKPLAQLSMEERTDYFNAAPEMVIDLASTYTASIVTSKGTMTVTLDSAGAPVSVNNFVLLASLGFYDGTPVNEVTPEQVAIIGAPANVPSSHAGYFFGGEVGSTQTWDMGSLAFLPAQDPLTGELVSISSQILIALTPPPVEANAQLSFFGQVVEGLDVLTSLANGDTIVEVKVETAVP